MEFEFDPAAGKISGESKVSTQYHFPVPFVEESVVYSIPTEITQCPSSGNMQVEIPQSEYVGSNIGCYQQFCVALFSKY